MNQNQNNPKSPSPAHHQQPHHARAASGDLAGGLKPEDLAIPKVAVHLKNGLPEIIIEQGNFLRAGPAPAETPPQAKSKAELIQEFQAFAGDIWLNHPERGHEVLKRAIEIELLNSGMVPEAVKEDMPFNAGKVEAGGGALLRATSASEGNVLKVKEDELGASLALCQRTRLLEEALQPALEIVVANRSIGLNDVAGHIVKALKRGTGVIEDNGALQRALKDSIEVKGGPVEAGLQKRAENARRDAAVRADERGKMGAEGGSEPPAGTTTTVTTQTPPVPSTPSVPAPKVPTGKGHKKAP